MNCTLCGKQVPKRYAKAHIRYHQEELQLGSIVPKRFHSPEQLAQAKINRRKYKVKRTENL